MVQDNALEFSMADPSSIDCSESLMSKQTSGKETNSSQFLDIDFDKNRGHQNCTSPATKGSDTISPQCQTTGTHLTEATTNHFSDCMETEESKERPKIVKKHKTDTNLPLHQMFDKKCTLVVDEIPSKEVSEASDAAQKAENSRRMIVDPNRNKTQTDLLRNLKMPLSLKMQRGSSNKLSEKRSKLGISSLSFSSSKFYAD